MAEALEVEISAFFNKYALIADTSIDPQTT